MILTAASRPAPVNTYAYDIPALNRECSKASTYLGKLTAHPRSFIDWFKSLERVGPGQDDPLFEWIAYYANREQLIWFAQQEYQRVGTFSSNFVNTESLVQRQRHVRDYLAELKHRDQALAYEAMLSEILKQVSFEAPELLSEVADCQMLFDSLASSSIHLGQSVGALSIREYSASRLLSSLYSAAHRLGFSSATRVYHCRGLPPTSPQLRLGSDPLFLMVSENFALAKSLAEGAWLNLCANARCFEAYRKRLFVY